MLREFLTGKDAFLALDIGATAIRILEVVRHGDAVKFQKYGYQVIDPNLNLVDDEASRQKLAETIKATLLANGIKSKDVIISLPSSVVTQKVVELKPRTDTELAETVQTQISRLESKSGPMVYDYQTLGDAPNDNGKIPILIAAAPSGVVGARVKMLESIGLRVIAVEPESLAVARAVTPIGNTGAELIVNVKDFETDYIVAVDGVPFLTRTAQFGAGLLVGMLQQNMRLDIATAQQYMADYGLNAKIMNGQIIAAVEPALRQFGSEASKSSELFAKKHLDVQIDGVLAVGYGASIPSFTDALSGIVGLPVEAADPWLNLSISDKAKAELAVIAPHFAVAAGLCERSKL